MGRALATASVATLALLACTAAPVAAQASRCNASKLKVTGKTCKGRTTCVAKAASRGDTVDTECLARAEARFATRFGNAESRRSCSTVGNAAIIEAKADAHVQDVHDELWNDEPTRNGCASTKLRAAGKSCACKLKCTSKAARKGAPVGPLCLRRCEARFTSAFTKAEDDGGCTTGGDAAAIETKSDAFMADVTAELQPSTTTSTTPTTTTTTTIPATCGNGAAEGAEECDDGGTTNGDGCSGACQLENTSALCAGVPSVGGTALDSVLVTGGLTDPVHVTAARLDPTRLFIVEQPGRIRLVKSGVLEPTPFLAIEGKVIEGSERGLLSVAFHPDYESNGFFYVNYTCDTAGNPGCPGNGDTVIARYQVSANPDLANAGSEYILFTVDQPFPNHNGGLNVFGPDGRLYVGMGDGGAGCDPAARAQNDADRLGKLLRVDVATEMVQTWAKGLRNPWRFSFDRLTGDLYIADVGQDSWEEINFVAAPQPPPAPPTGNLNYGWDFYEGRHCSSAPQPEGSSCSGDPCPSPPTGLTGPVLEYSHAQGCSVTGGFVYRGCAMSAMRGRYFYSDACTPFIRSFRGVSPGGEAQDPMDHTADLAPGSGAIGGVSSFGEDARGELYIVDYAGGANGQGEVYKIVPGS